MPLASNVSLGEMDDVRAAVQQQFQIVCDHINSDTFRAELPQNSGDLFHVPVIKAAGGFVKEENRPL